MLIDFACPCGYKLQVADDQAGTRHLSGLRPTTHGPHSPDIASSPPAITATRPPEDREDTDDFRPRRFARAQGGGSSAAIVALILGAGSIFLNLLTAVPAIILAIIALSNNRRRGGGGLNIGLAIAALIVACLGTVVSGFVVYRAYRSVEDARDRLMVGNNFHLITLAMVDDADDNQGRLVAPAICSKDGKPLLSWRTRSAAVSKNNDSVDEFHLDKP